MSSARAIQQMRLNILAVLAHHQLPPIHVLTAQTDRVTATAPPEFRVALQRAAFKAWPFAQNHGTTAIASWRECCPRYSLQAVEHRDELWPESGTLWEFDIDYVNPHPEEGVAFTVGHGVEVLLNWLRRRKSNPFKIRRGLVKRGIVVEEAI